MIRLGFEPKTHSLEGCCSIQLSYQTIAICGCKNSDFFDVRACFFGKKQKNALFLFLLDGLAVHAFLLGCHAVLL